MKRLLTLALIVFLVPAVAGARDGLKKVYDDDADQMVQIDRALKQAKAESKFVICQVGGNWCPWCLKFADFITKDEEISKLIDENFVYIHVNYDRRSFKDNPKKEALTKKMMERLGNPARFGYPVMVVLDEKGKIIHTQDSGLLEEGDGYNRKKVMSFFSKWTPSAVR